MGSGPPFVILHGLFGISDNWHTVGKKLSEKYSVFLVDQRNHGQSPHSNEWDYKLMAEDLHELFIDNQIENAVLMGHSMGGKTAMLFAMTYPELLKKLVVVDIAPKTYPPQHDKIIAALKAVNFNITHSRKAAEEILAGNIQEPAIRQFLLKNLEWEKPDQLRWKFNLDAISRNIETIDRSFDIKVCEIPTFFIRGALSQYITDSDRETIKEYFPKSSLITVPDAGHWVHADNPAGFFRCAEEYLTCSGNPGT